MTGVFFSAERLPVTVRPEVVDAMDDAWSRLAAPGAWLTGAERVQAAEIALAACPREIGEGRPEPRELSHPGDGGLSELEKEVVRRIAAEAWTLSKEWFERVTERLPVARYAELVAIVATVVPIERFCRLIGHPLPSLPAPRPGIASGEYPDNVADDGAWLPLQVPWDNANVARALSVVPEDNRMRLSLVRTMYSRPDAFARLRWDDWPLSRSQVELLAARTSALNQCFY